jgi:hypothetical protein
MRLALVIPASLLLVGATLLTGCGGSHKSSNDNGDATANGGFNMIPTPSTDDPFITIVRQQTDTPAAMSEETVAIDLSQIVATSPEDTQPQTVTF